MLDEPGVLTLLRAAEETEEIDGVVDQVVLPALVEAGRRWEQGSLSVAQEHMLSEVVRGWLALHINAAPSPPPQAPRVLVACPEDERHDLAALALSLLLRRAALRVTYLGGDVPTSALVAVSREVRFDAICLSATATTSLPIARLACSALLTDGSKAHFYVGGRAILAASEDEASSIAAVRLPDSLRASAALVVSRLVGDVRSGR